MGGHAHWRPKRPKTGPSGSKTGQKSGVKRPQAVEMGPKLPEVGAGAEGKQVPVTVEGLEGTARVEADAKPRSKGAPRVQGMGSDGMSRGVRPVGGKAPGPTVSGWVWLRGRPAPGGTPRPVSVESRRPATA